MDYLEDIRNAVISGDESQVKLLVLEAMSDGLKAADIMSKALVSAMDIVGEKMEAEDIFIPEVLMSANAMNAGVKRLKPHLLEGEEVNLGVAVIGSVQGDMHDIGKNLVNMMMEGAGFKTVDLGTDVTAQVFVDAAKSNNATIIGMSALLTTTMPFMKEVIDTLEKEGIRDQVKVIVGGAPVTQEYADEIGADAYGTDAGSAVRIAKALLN